MALNGKTMDTQMPLQFEQLIAIENALDNPKVAVPVHCLYCDEPVPVTLSVNGDHNYIGSPEELANYLDALAAERCPCLGNVLFGIGHKSTRRKLVREAIEDARLDQLPYKSEYQPRWDALQQAWADLQPGK